MKIPLLATCIAALLPGPFLPGQLRAADHYNLEDGLPVEVADSIPIKYRSREAQGLFRWEHTEEGEEELLLVPRLEYGLWLNTQVSLDAPYEFGEAVEDDEFRTAGLELLYNFNQEGFLLPAAALAGRADFPLGEEEEGVDPTLKLIFSKTIGRSAQWQRLHLNGAWHHNSEAAGDERSDRYKIILGYDRRLNADTLLVLDLVREEEKEENEEANLVEAGIRYQLTPLTVIAAGAGAGIGEDGPDFRATLAFQHSFNAWYLGGR